MTGVIFLVLLLMSSLAHAATRYVDVTLGGNCTAGDYSIAARACTGSDGNAYNTLQGGINATTAPGDILLLRSGTSTATVTTAAAGTMANPIVIQRYQAETFTQNNRVTVNHSYITWDGLTSTTTPAGMNLFSYASTATGGVHRNFSYSNTARRVINNNGNASTPISMEVTDGTFSNCGSDFATSGISSSCIRLGTDTTAGTNTYVLGLTMRNITGTNWGEDFLSCSGCSDVLIENNTIDNASPTSNNGEDGFDVKHQKNNVIIRNNRITNMRQNAIFMNTKVTVEPARTTSNTTIEYNYIENAGYFNGFPISLNEVGAPAPGQSGVTLHGNVIVLNNNNSDYAVNNTCSKGVQILNNTIIGTGATNPNGGLRQRKADSSTIRDNLFWNLANPSIDIVSTSLACGCCAMTGTVENYNAFDTSTAGGVVVESDSGTGYTEAQLAAYQSATGNGANSTFNTNPLFVDATLPGIDANLQTGSPTIGTSSVSQNKGAHQEITRSSASISGTTLTRTWATNGALPISACSPGLFTVKYGSTTITETSCTPGSPSGNQTTSIMASAPLATDTVTETWTYGAIEDSVDIGTQQNKLRAQAVAQSITNQSTGAWLAGNQRTAPSGSNRLMVIGFCWEFTPTSPPLDISAVTYGGQSCTQIAAVDVPASQTVETTLLEGWYCNEAAIAAATSTAIAWTTSETPNAAKPVAVVSGFYSDVGQSTPIIDTQTAMNASTTTLTTSALSTVNGGAAVMLACSGNTGTYTALGSGWTEQLAVGEDASPTLNLLAADRATTDSTVTPDATFSSTTRLAMIGVSLDASASPPPPSSPILTQTAMRCGLHNEPLYRWLTPENHGCHVTPGSALYVHAQYKTTQANESPSTIKMLQCCDNGVCSSDGDYYQVGDTFSAGHVAYTASPVYAHGDTIGSRQLSDPTGTFVSGRLHGQASGFTSALASGQYTELGFAVQINSAISTPATLKCRLMRGSNTPLTAYAAGTILPITVTAGGVASGF